MAATSVNRKAAISRIREVLGDRLLRIDEKSARRVFLEVMPSDVPDLTRLMLEGLQARFQIASGVDTPTAIEVL